MTNADKYLKDGVDIMQMLHDYNQTGQKCPSVWKWLEQSIKPTLTEDEKAILRNIEHPYKWIRRNHKGELQISDKEDCAGLKWFINFTCYQSLFLFIKKGEEYSIKELLDDE